MNVADGEATFSIGAYLERQRRLRGVSLEELEVTTRIPRRSLERLEAGAFDRDRDAFARSFVKAVAQALGLDVQDTIARMLAEVRPGRRARGGDWLRARALWIALACVAASVVGLGAVRVAREGLAWPRLAWSRNETREPVVRADPVRALAREAKLRAALEAAPPKDGPAAPAP